MTAKSIVDIEIRDSQFREFYELFEGYQQKLQEMPDDWKNVVDAMDDAGEGIEHFSDSSKSSKEYLMIAAIQADAITKAIQKAGGVQEKFNTKAKDGAIHMGRMALFSKELHKSISSMSSILLKLGAVGASGITSAIGAVYGATTMLAGQNLQARGLGLRIGQTQAFSANFEKFGLGASDLGSIANAQGDVSKWRALISAGLTPQQIQNEDAEQLTYDFARAASGKYREWQKAGLPAASMAQAYGFTDLLSLQQLRTGASYGDQEWQKAQHKEMIAAQKAAVDQETADQASDVKAALSSDWAQVINTFNDDLAKAGPDLVILADAATNAALALSKFLGQEVTPVIHEVLSGQPTPKGSANYTRADQFVDWLHGTDAGKWVDEHILGVNGQTSSLQSKKGMSAMLAAQYQIESDNGKKLLSRKGAKGPMQFMPDTWREWGHGDINNLNDSMDAANRYDQFLLKRYGGDVRKALAAYNWGMGHLDKDIQHNGSKWESFAPAETQEYIKKALGLMAWNGQNVNINITNSTPSRVAVSMNAAPH